MKKKEITTMKKSYKIEVDCANCANKMEEAAKNTAGVKDASVNLSLIHILDAADNLFPSIHCLVSWFCYLGIRGRKEIPVWYQRVSMVIAVLVFASTLLTKQHVIVDVAGGILLAELCFFIGRKTQLYRIYEKLGSRIEKKILKITEG